MIRIKEFVLLIFGITVLLGLVVLAWVLHGWEWCNAYMVARRNLRRTDW